jgi:hypothetical protein
MSSTIPESRPMMLLSDLPAGHSLRNRSLAEIGAQYRFDSSDSWKTVTAQYAIAPCSYNDLRASWTHRYQWRAPKPEGSGNAD